MDSQGLVRGGLWITGGRLFAVASRFLAGLMVARLLGPVGRGQYAILILVPTLLAQILNLGLGQANTFLLGRQHVPAGHVAANGLLLGGLGGTILVAGLLIIYWLWQPPFPSDVPLFLLALSCASVPFTLVHYFSSYALLGLGEVRKFGMLLFVEGGGQLIYLTLFLVVGRWGLVGATLAWTLTAVTHTFFSVAWLVRPALSTLRPDLGLLRRTLSYGLKIYPAGIMQYLNLRFDQFLVEYFAGAGPLGLYVVAVSLTEAAWQIPIALSTALFSRVSTSTDRQADAVTPRILRVTLAVTVSEVGLLLLLGRPSIRFLFGPDFEAALPAFHGLLLGTVFYAMARVLEGDLAGRGYPLVTSLAVGAAVLTTIILDLLWIPRWGIQGAAWASSVAYTLNAAILAIAFMRITGARCWRVPQSPWSAR